MCWRLVNYSNAHALQVSVAGCLGYDVLENTRRLGCAIYDMFQLLVV